MKMNMALACPLLLLFLSALPCYNSYYSDQQALLSFKHSLSLDSSNSLLDWSPNHSLCNWTGVACSSRHQRVVSLNLTGMSLAGTISPFLGNLSFLRVLALKNNSFHGQIPSQLGRLLRLRVLRLSRNKLQGSIPSTLANCHLLQRLILSYNLLSGAIPSQLGILSHLEMLILGENQLTGVIPRTLGNLSSLVDLELLENELHGDIPVELGMLTQLENLYLGHNNLTGVIPIELGMVIQLRMLDLGNNQLTGHIPWQLALSQLPNLQRLYLDKNDLDGRIPESFGHAKQLGLLVLSENMLSGQIPESLGDLPQLRDLFLHHNQLSGRIPASLGRCITLEKVDLSHNKLEGNIPPEWINLTNLQFYFNISSNSLQGSILAMSKMVMVQAIDVSLNNFLGEIPAVLSSCTNLQYLNLSWNSFDGPIPASLTSLKYLQDIDLSSNNLSGTIPMAFQEMKMLQHINLSSNRLTGEVPKGGVFARIDESAILGNVGLCGTWIKLKSCSNSQHKQFLVSEKVMVPVVIGITIFILSSILFLLFYKRHINQDSLELNTGLARISYEELEDATSGFSQTNLLGVGSFGSVYRGILNNGTNIAVKVLNLQEKNALKSFERECNVLKRVRHRNVIKIISAYSNLDFKALVLPFMSNGSLEMWLYPKGGDICRLSLSDRLRIAKEVAEGMEYLHHHCFVQVIHCDLKPNNVLLGNDMTAHISVTSASILKGSVGYFAPEYGVGGKISTKGDVYSYGILLLELLTRRRPTNTMFLEGINLPKWASMGFPNKIEEVLDNHLLRDVNVLDKEKVLECLTQFLQVGLVCTRELPQQRPNMMEIVERLKKITSTYLGTPRDFHLPINISALLESTSGQRNTNSRSPENWSTSTS
ncbi:hypothetical protein SUGI_0374320 [Cryptomeria japonica]|nr:hypothetical protein SUGI_0374320 [Cryptomeria japonica]